MQLVLYLFTCLGLALLALADDCATITAASATWTIAEKIDGSEKYITVNTAWPAQKLVYPRCTKLTLTVTNTLPSDSISLHFHGLLQNNGQAMMDGVVGLTQRFEHGAVYPFTANWISGIAPTKTFTYILLLDTEGTYWIHSHSPGQYPRGLRAPLIVTPTGTSTIPADEVITLSDWWTDFQVAEARSLATDSTTCGVEGNANTPRNVGIELPPERVTFNDVFGYNKAGTTADQKRIARTIQVTCNTARKIRIINTSAFARFYVGFSDGRDFAITELDGISYQAKTTAWLELASGQRASIVVDGYSSIQKKCANAYILALSDPKVNAGTPKCPMSKTNPNFSIQYAHGYLQVGSQQVPDHDDLTPDVDFPGDWARVWSGSGIDDTLQNRIKIPYKGLYTNPGNDADYGLQKVGSRNVLSIMGVDRADELTMTPVTPIGMWAPPDDSTKTSRMHYIALDHLADPADPSKDGYAAMTEYLSVNPYTEWKSPAGVDAPSSGRTSNDVPSMYRVLRDSFDNTKISTPDTYYSDPKAQKGKTIMINDGQPHWFIIRSNRGDHPMHMHGHHFQVLAKLPRGWWDQNYQSLYNHVTSTTIKTDGKADLTNPPRRDTIMIDKGFTYVIAISADNPGVWAFHCHNDIHAVSGMFSQIIERPIDFRAKLGSWDYNPTGSKQEMRWYTSNQATLSWRSKDVAGDWMVANFKAAIDRYGWTAGYTAFNSKNPSKWDIVKRWLPRGSRWY